jgi:hypothetical protein
MNYEDGLRLRFRKRKNSEQYGSHNGFMGCTWLGRFFPFPSGFLDERDAVKVFQEMLSTKMCFFFSVGLRTGRICAEKISKSDHMTARWWNNLRGDCEIIFVCFKNVKIMWIIRDLCSFHRVDFFGNKFWFWYETLCIYLYILSIVSVRTSRHFFPVDIGKIKMYTGVSFKN